MRVSAGRVNALLWWAAILIYYPDLAQAGKAKRPSLCTAACMTAFQAVKFSDEGPQAAAAQMGRYCQSEMLLESLFLCMRLHCDTHDRDQIDRDVRWLDLDETCSGGKRGIPSYEDVVGKWTEGEVSRVRRFNATVPGAGTLLDEVALPGDGYYDLWWGTLVSYSLRWKDVGLRRYGG